MPDIGKTIGGLHLGPPDTVVNLKIEFPHGVTSALVRPQDLTEDDEQEIIELLRVAFDGRSWFDLPVPALDHWRWKVNDFPGVVLLRRFDRDGTFSGILAYRWWPWLVRGRLRSRRSGADLAFHPSLQGMGILSASAEYGRDHPEEFDADFIFSASTHPTAQHLQRRLGKPPAENRLQTLMKLLDVSGYVRMQHRAAEPSSNSRTMNALRAEQRRRIPRPYAARLAVWHLRRLRARLTTRPRLRRPRQTWTIRTIEQFDDRIDRFLEQAAKQFDLILYRNQDYLNWRYCDRRAGPFTIRLAEQDGEILGYAVVRPSNEIGLFAELLALPGRTDVAASLVDDAVDQLRAGGALAIRSWMISNHPYNPILKTAGFFPIINLGEITYTDNTPDGALFFLQDPQAKVHFVMGDSDGL